MITSPKFTEIAEWVFATADHEEYTDKDALRNAFYHMRKGPLGLERDCKLVHFQCSALLPEHADKLLSFYQLVVDDCAYSWAEVLNEFIGAVWYASLLKHRSESRIRCTLRMAAHLDQHIEIMAHMRGREIAAAP